MGYIENPKTAGSGILCAIPQRGECPVKCKDCFFQSGRSFLEPLDENLPNLPPVEATRGKVVRINDGNDSNNQRQLVMSAAAQYEHAFFNTSMPKNLKKFGRPVVLTVNPGKKTDRSVHLVKRIPPNLMFVRFRANTWNINLCDAVVDHYTKRENPVPVVLTFMAYYTEPVPEKHQQFYSFRQRTLNSYWVITQNGWDRVLGRYAGNQYVYACGKDADTFKCHRCGNCLREYFATIERMRGHK
jgi:hypothetical protein